MPWCDECNRYLSPSTVRSDGSCPSCDRLVAPGGARQAGEANVDDDADALDPLPWHFKLLVGAIALYLGYRAYQGVEWIVGLL